MQRAITFSALALVGCSSLWGPPNEIPAGVLDALRASDRVELFSLDPHPHEVVKENPQYYPNGNESAIIGSVQLNDRQLQSQIADALQRDVEAGSEFEAGCFLPRHALLIHSEANEVVEIVICYQCMNASIFIDDRLVESVLLSGTSKDLLNRLLDEAGIERAQPY